MPDTPGQLEAALRAALAREDYEDAEALGARLDAALARPAPALLPSALWYAEQGLHVFPLQPRSKVPLPGSRGCKDATTDAARIRAWWRRTPDANVAIATGHLIDVLDVDGPTGVLSWCLMLDRTAPADLPAVLGVVSTPRAGGTHHYVAARPGRTNRAGLMPGVDVRGAGGYVVAPPSVNAEGVRYTWRRPLELSALAVAA